MSQYPSQSSHSNQAKAVILQDQQEINNLIESARQFVERDYMNTLTTPRCSAISTGSAGAGEIRMCRFEKIVLGTEDPHSRLLSVFHAIGSISDACFLLIHGEPKAVEFYLGLRSGTSAPMALEALSTSLKGNFPGTQFAPQDTALSEKLLSALFSPDSANAQAVASVSRVPSLRKNQASPDGNITVQGLEHFIDAMRGHTYTALILAEPITVQNTVLRRNALEQISSALSVMEKINYQYSDSMTLSEQHSVNQSLSESISNSVSNGYNMSHTANSGVNKGSSSSTNTHFFGLGYGFGSQQGSFTSQGTQLGTSQQWQQGTGIAVQHGTANTSGVSLGMSESWTMSYSNKAISNLLQLIDLQLERIRSCETYGCWDSCAFFLAPHAEIARVAAGNYHALVCGDNSGRDNAGVHVWTPLDKDCAEDRKTILASLRSMKMPQFLLDRKFPFTIGTMVSSEELPLMMNFPRTSVSGVPVIQMAAFGREVKQISGNPPQVAMKVGDVFHMGQIEMNASVHLSVDDLPAHLLCCGMPGVGKSTTLSMFLDKLCRNLNTNFLLVEPVKGEYKYLLGNLPGLQVFTTDPLCCRMLKINPFEFPEGIHVLSHIDRLIEVFSVCWPLYAAQPALLRECIEEAYLQTGWDLSNSVYVNPGSVKYPTFSLLLEIIPQIIEHSRFVGESKGTYEGALLTRVGMLTHGVYGQVFNGSACVADKELFDGKVVVDLSTVGSKETLALLMGILIIRMREYRSVTGKADNRPLHHLLVLEEAHNILQRGSSQNSEGGENVSGKAVEMLAQCISEMRSYGQGVIIADQSPSLLDPSCLRNTATKIIMRLPEAEDQQAVADSMSLREDQTRELAHLPRQVAVIYQGGWIEPVLTRISDTKIVPAQQVDQARYAQIRQLRSILTKAILAMHENGPFDGRALEALLQGMSFINPSKKKDYTLLIQAYQASYTNDRIQGDQQKEIHFYGRLLTELLACEDLFKLARIPVYKGNAEDAPNDPVFRSKCGRWKQQCNDVITRYVDGLTADQTNHLIRLLMLADSRDYKVIHVHNLLFGKIGPRA